MAQDNSSSSGVARRPRGLDTPAVLSGCLSKQNQPSGCPVELTAQWERQTGDRGDQGKLYQSQTALQFGMESRLHWGSSQVWGWGEGAGEGGQQEEEHAPSICFYSFEIHSFPVLGFASTFLFHFILILFFKFIRCLHCSASLEKGHLPL